MNALIKKATIICPTSPFHLQVKDVLVVDGIIKAVEDNISAESSQIISGDNLHLSIGWMDIFADFAEPGNEHRETLETGANAAAAGGFTDVMLIPNTLPTVSSKAQIEFLIERSKPLPVTVHPIGAVTNNTEGTALTEMYDMHNSGAVAFGDGTKSIQQAGILLKAYNMFPQKMQ